MPNCCCRIEAASRPLIHEWCRPAPHHMYWRRVCVVLYDVVLCCAVLATALGTQHHSGLQQAAWSTRSPTSMHTSSSPTCSPPEHAAAARCGTRFSRETCLRKEWATALSLARPHHPAPHARYTTLALASDCGVFWCFGQNHTTTTRTFFYVGWSGFSYTE